MTTIAMMAMFACSFISCGGDDDNEETGNTTTPDNTAHPNDKKKKSNLIVKVSSTSNDRTVGMYTFSYDEKGNLTDYVSYESGSMHLKERNSDKVVLSYRLGLNTTNYIDMTIKLNAQGLCEETIGGDVTKYDSDGYLIETKNKAGVYSLWKYTYKNGDLSLVSHKGSDYKVSYTETYNSSTELNDANLDLNFFILNDNTNRDISLFGLLGKKSRHILSYMKTEQTGVYDWIEYSNVDVTRDAKGRIFNIKYAYKAGKGKKVNELQKIVNIVYGDN